VICRGIKYVFIFVFNNFLSVPFQAPILMFRNEVRTQLNNKAVVHKAIQMGQELMVCVAQDTCKGKPIEDPTLIKKLLEIIR
jgi:hypothetical protein